MRPRPVASSVRGAVEYGPEWPHEVGPSLTRGVAAGSGDERLPSMGRSSDSARRGRLDVFGKTEAAGQRGVGEEGDLVDLAAAQGEHHHAPGLRAHVVAEGRLAVGAGRA